MNSVWEKNKMVRYLRSGDVIDERIKILKQGVGGAKVARQRRKTATDGLQHLPFSSELIEEWTRAKYGRSVLDKRR